MLEGPVVDDAPGLTRVRARSMRDAQEGWITVKGNQGTPYLKEVDKPYYACNAEVELEGDVPRTLKHEEVFELLQGPQKEVFADAQRIRGKASKDGATGWITSTDFKGVVFAEPCNKYYTCTTTVAMTDAQDIKNCKVIRKMTVGENFIAEEDPVVEADSGITRVKAKGATDENAGWITIKGNAGTTYAVASTKHYNIVKDVPLQKLLNVNDSAQDVRKLEAGEAFELIEGPKNQKAPPAVRMKVKVLGDGAVGWITMKQTNVRKWQPVYTCKKAVAMHKALAVKDAEVVKQINVGQVLELIDGPQEDTETKEMRMKGRIGQDGSVGWVTIRDSSGTKFLVS